MEQLDPKIDVTGFYFKFTLVEGQRAKGGWVYKQEWRKSSFCSLVRVLFFHFTQSYSTQKTEARRRAPRYPGDMWCMPGLSFPDHTRVFFSIMQNTQFILSFLPFPLPPLSLGSRLEC